MMRTKGIWFAFVLALAVIFALAAPAFAGVRYVVSPLPGEPGGGSPTAPLLQLANGQVWGVSTIGGTGNCQPGGCGTIFEMVAGVPETAHSFNASDGFNPTAGLAQRGGLLYGTTSMGGSGSIVGDSTPDGTLFSIDPVTLNYNVLFQFYSNTTLGSEPQGSLVSAGWLLFGTTSLGVQPENGGSLFRFDTQTNSMTVEHVFGPGDDGLFEGGSNPAGRLALSGRYLFGVTRAGGPNRSGELYRVDLTSGAFSILHGFNVATEGRPWSGPVLYQGRLYGTTFGPYGVGGTVYSVETDGTNFEILHLFNNPVEGQAPAGAPAIGLDGALYGTAAFGGDPKLEYPVLGEQRQGGGTLWRLDLHSGSFSAIHVFSGTRGDGATPLADLAPGTLGMLLGTTFYGGRTGPCLITGTPTCGTAFEFLYPYPPISPSRK